MPDKPTPTTDLLKRGVEIHEGRSTGVLSGEALRDYAKRKWPGRRGALQMAERETGTEALALLAKWGQPVVAGDVDRADAVNLARNALTQYDCAITKKGVRVLAEAVLSMDSALTTPQPTQAQAGAVPLTPERVKEIVRGAGYDQCGIPDTERAAFINGLRHGERAHGIKGGQHVS